MSRNNKRNLWQKIKQLLNKSVPYSTDAAKTPQTDTDTDKNSAEDDLIKAPIIKANRNSNGDTPITDYLKQYFHDKQWHYTYYRPRTNDSQQSHHLSLRMRNKQLECGYLFRIQEDNSLLAVYGILPF